MKMSTDSKPTPERLAIWIAQYFAEHRSRTADVLSGPKRETWFSAETYVALCKAIAPDDEFADFPSFSYWGEQEYKTMFEVLESECPTAGDLKRKPDIVCYNTLEGPEAVASVIEIKLVRNDEKLTSCLTKLKAQVSNASSLFPGADIVGIVFFATAPFLTPETLESASMKLKERIKTIFPKAEGFLPIAGFELRPIFHLEPTSFHYPKMYTSLSAAVLHLPSRPSGSR